MPQDPNALARTNKKVQLNYSDVSMMLNLLYDSVRGKEHMYSTFEKRGLITRLHSERVALVKKFNRSNQNANSKRKHRVQSQDGRDVQYERGEEHSRADIRKQQVVCN